MGVIELSRETERNYNAAFKHGLPAHDCLLRLIAKIEREYLFKHGVRSTAFSKTNTDSNRCPKGKSTGITPVLLGLFAQDSVDQYSHDTALTVGRIALNIWTLLRQFARTIQQMRLGSVLCSSNNRALFESRTWRVRTCRQSPLLSFPRSCPSDPSSNKLR